EICHETVSGRAADDDRYGLRHVEALAQLGKVRKVLVHEISRLGRKNSVAHRFVETLEECGVSLYWHAQGLETLLPNGARILQRRSCSRYLLKWRVANWKLCGIGSIQDWQKLDAKA